MASSPPRASGCRGARESYKWFAIAAKAGDNDAAKKRDEVAKALQPDQLQRAHAKVDPGKQSQLDPEANSVEIPDPGRMLPPRRLPRYEEGVRNIQAILNNNGFDAGNPDGVMGQQTMAAIKAFQTDNKMEPTGEIDEKLVRALLDRK